MDNFGESLGLYIKILVIGGIVAGLVVGTVIGCAIGSF